MASAALKFTFLSSADMFVFFITSPTSTHAESANEFFHHVWLRSVVFFLSSTSCSGKRLCVDVGHWDLGNPRVEACDLHATCIFNTVLQFVSVAMVISKSLFTWDSCSNFASWKKMRNKNGVKDKFRFSWCLGRCSKMTWMRIWKTNRCDVKPPLSSYSAVA